MTIYCRRIACRITKTTNTQSEYVVLIAFPLQRWLYERASMLRYTYIASLFRLYVTYDQLISERNYPSSSMSKCNFAIFNV